MKSFILFKWLGIKYKQTILSIALTASFDWLKKCIAKTTEQAAVNAVVQYTLSSQNDQRDSFNRRSIAVLSWKKRPQCFYLFANSKEDSCALCKYSYLLTEVRSVEPDLSSFPTRSFNILCFIYYNGHFLDQWPSAEMLYSQKYFQKPVFAVEASMLPYQSRNLQHQILFQKIPRTLRKHEKLICDSNVEDIHIIISLLPSHSKNDERKCFKTDWDFFRHNLYNTANTTVLTITPNNTVQGFYSSSKVKFPDFLLTCPVKITQYSLTYTATHFSTESTP